MKRNEWRCVGALALCLLAGCSVGPYALRSDRAAYNVAVQKSANEQILLNLVRLKYREPTLFLEISGISANFSYSIGADMSGNLPEARDTGTVHVGGSSRYAENPTITYTPLQGEQVAKRLMAEMDLRTFLLLQRAGWNISRLMRLGVERIGDLHNDPSARPLPGETESSYAQFMKFTDLLARLKLNGVLRFGLEPSRGAKIADASGADALRPSDFISASKEGYELIPRKEGKVEIVRTGAPLLVMEAELSDEDWDEFERFLKPLSGRPLRSAPETLSLVLYLRHGKDERRVEAQIQFRSFLDMLYYLAQAVEVPEAHVEKGFVKKRWHAEVEGKGVGAEAWRQSILDLMNIHCSRIPPRQAFVSVFYRGHWFYIDDADVKSKDTFALLSLIFALQAGEVPATLPVLTIPVTGQ